MITRMKITPDDIKYSKNLTNKFNKIKTHDKFKCDNNWMGFLGEIMFKKLILHHHMKGESIKWTWKRYLTTNWDDPDFIINGQTFDVKTTQTPYLWFQKPIWGVYVLCHVNEDCTECIFSYVIGNDLLENDKVDHVVRVGRTDNRLPLVYMNTNFTHLFNWCIT